MPEDCVFCGKCERICPTHCIDFTQEPQSVTTSVGAVVVATGLDITPMGKKPEYGGGRLANVMSPLQMERVQSSNGPYGRVLRPADGKIPRSIAYVQCAGSRDRSIGVPYCSRVCCMYAIKQALLLRHYIHGVDVTLYHMDIRAFGKGYEQFYRRAMAEGVKIVKGKVGRITEVDNYDLLVRVELLDADDRVVERRHDLVVLAQGIVAAWNPKGVIDLSVAEDGFLQRPQAKLNPSYTTMEGVFMAGAAAGPKDIPDAIVEAGEAAMSAAIYLYRTRGRAPAAAHVMAH